MEQPRFVIKKRTIGILGGMGPAASAGLYQKIISVAQKKYGARQDCDFPPIILYSLPLDDWDTTGFLNLESVKRQLIAGVRKLEESGCDFIVIACNTAHHFCREMQSAVNIPIINMIEETVKVVANRNYKTAAVLGTESSRKLKIYQNVLNKNNISNAPLTDDEQAMVTNVISHIEGGTHNYTDTKILKGLIERLKIRGAQTIILGCTELPIALKQKDIDIELFDTVDIICHCALQRALCTSFQGFVQDAAVEPRKTWIPRPQRVFLQHF